jgi:hypothetical protein
LTGEAANVDGFTSGGSVFVAWTLAGIAAQIAPKMRKV